jgi:hypothetical protein
MKILNVFLAVILVTFILGCAATRPTSASGGYLFEYDGEYYRIESITPKDDVGYNMLLLGKDDVISFKAVDHDQDGQLDKVVKGDRPLDELQGIYESGLAIGRAKGSVKQRMHAREYRTSDMINSYVLQTYRLASGDVFNKLSIISKRSFGNPLIVLDLKADGSLNRIKDSQEKPDRYQFLYDSVLKRGVNDGRIIHAGDLYEVLADAM